MKKIFAIISMVLFTVAVSGCKDYLDINENPNYLTSQTPEALLPAAQMYSSFTIGGEVQLVTSFWNQYYTQYTSANQYWTIVRNNLSYTDANFRYLWNQMYLYSIPNYRDIQKYAAEHPGYEAYDFVARIGEAYNWYIMNSLFDRIAYTNGMNGTENANPEFDSVENSYSIVKGLFAEIVNGYSSSYDDVWTSSDGILYGTGKDFVFNGDIDAWYAFANTIYLKLLLRDVDANLAEIEKVLDNDLGFIDENTGCAKIDAFVDLDSQSNPMYESDRRQLNSTKNIRACASMVNFLNEAGDPRVGFYFEPATNGSYVGGNYNAGGGSSTSRAALAPTDPIYLMTIADAYLTRAEALYAVGGDMADVKELYDAGVLASFDLCGEDGTEFIEEGGVYEFNPDEDIIDQIMLQKWLQGARVCAWEPFFDNNRLDGVRHGEILQDYSGNLGAGNYPRRFLYPQVSALYNTNSPELVPLGEKMWWHK